MNLVKHIDGIKQIKTIKQKGQNEITFSSEIV